MLKKTAWLIPSPGIYLQDDTWKLWKEKKTLKLKLYLVKWTKSVLGTCNPDDCKTELSVAINVLFLKQKAIQVSSHLVLYFSKPNNVTLNTKSNSS